MSASLTDKITDVRNGARPNSARVVTSRIIGGTNLACNDLSGWPTASKVHFVTYQIDTNSNPVLGSQLDCYGIVSGNTITQIVVVDGVDGGSSVGDVVEMLPTAAWGQDLADALMRDHNRDGSHQSNIIGADQLQTNAVTSIKIIDSAVTTSKINDSAVTTAKINDSAVTSAKLAPSKTTDANGWTVYNFGSFKQYVFTQYQSIYIVNGQRAQFSTYPLPAGKTITDCMVVACMWEGGYSGHAVVGVEPVGSGGWNINVGNQYVGGPLVFSGKVRLVVMDV